MDPTKRFSNRVENYRRYRPSYPKDVIDLISQTARMEPGAKIADIGSGTGILTRLLLDAGWNVYAVEPNAPMREAAEADLNASPLFHSLDGTGEATSLPQASMNAITCAQSFHWLEREAAHTEFHRILRPGGWVFLIWNERRSGSNFDDAYHRILATLGQAFEGVRHRANEKGLDSLFLPETYREAVFPNPIRLTWEGLRGRFLSSSYVPTEDDPRYPALIAELEKVFRENQADGVVVQDQDTHVYFGQV